MSTPNKKTIGICYNVTIEVEIEVPEHFCKPVDEYLVQMANAVQLKGKLNNAFGNRATLVDFMYHVGDINIHGIKQPDGSMLDNGE